MYVFCSIITSLVSLVHLSSNIFSMSLGFIIIPYSCAFITSAESDRVGIPVQGTSWEKSISWSNNSLRIDLQCIAHKSTFGQPQGDESWGIADGLYSFHFCFVHELLRASMLTNVQVMSCFALIYLFLVTNIIVALNSYEDMKKWFNYVRGL